jgi:nitroreductase
MTVVHRWTVSSLLVLALSFSAGTSAQESVPVPLPKPQTEGGKPLMQALKERKSGREFASRRIPDQVLSNMLWAGAGINRPDGKRTAPTARNRQEIDVYVVTAEGASLYDPKAHALRLVAPGDFRAQAGTQDYAKDAPVNLIFVADTAKTGGGSSEDTLLYIGADTGFISQNIYLFCASEGLATVVRASVDRAALAKALGLRPEQRIVLAQSVGYPKQ